MVVGRFESPEGTISLSSLDGPECPRVTHVVRGVTAGAFRFYAGSATAVGAAAAGFGAKVGGASSREEQVLSRDGSFEACAGTRDGDGPPRDCGALLRVELAKIDQISDKPVIKQERVCPPGEQWADFHGCQRLEATSQPTASRFALSGGALMDTTTGLMWQRDQASATMPWDDAKRFCLSLAVDGQSGWRLPKKKELVTLVNKASPGAKLDTSAFSSSPAAAFWSMSADASSAGDAWAVDFHDGREVSKGSGERLFVRCVR
jgi:hypothetical protein